MAEQQAPSQAQETGHLTAVRRWLYDNWAEESNLGKAKLAGLLVLGFLLLLTLLPVAEQAPLPVTRSVEERQATETYDQYQARIAQLEQQQKDRTEVAAAEAAAAYQSYTARIAALEQAGGDDPEVLADAARQAAQAYASYTARIADLEARFGVDLAQAEQEAAAAYDFYAARVAELEQDRQRLSERVRAQQAHIAELERALTQAGADPPVGDAQALRAQRAAIKAALEQVLRDLETAPEGE